MYAMHLLEVEARLREPIDDGDGDFYLDDEEFIEDEIKWHRDNSVRRRFGLAKEGVMNKSKGMDRKVCALICIHRMRRA